MPVDNKTRPTGEQLRFRSAATGDHILDDYLEASEKGGRTLPDLLDDIFDSSGVFAASNFEFRIEPSTRKYQVRVGLFANGTAGWTDIPNGFVFRQRGTYANATAYEQLDVVTVSNSSYVCTVAHTSSTATPDLTKFVIILDGAALNTATTSAQTSATNAANSASAASTSATNAANSATAAQTSATNAASSASTATTQAGIATTQASNASGSATAAASSASSASSSATSASGSATSAATSATTATTQATNAANSASSASASASTATTQASNAAASASAAATSATNASNSASAASTSASNAATSATAAASSATSASAAQLAAESARDSALAAYDNFDDRYLGPKASDPTVDNDGNALIAGALYFNTALGYMKVYTGTAWVDAYAAGTSFVAKAGSTMTGALVLYGNAAANLEAVPKQQLDSGLALKANIASPTFTGTVVLPSATSIGSVTNTEISYLSGVTSSIQTQINAKLDTAATTYVIQTGPTGAANLPNGTSAQRPGAPVAGQVRYNTSTGKFEGYSSTWGNLGGGAAISDTPPSNPGAGDLWWNSSDGNLYVYYTDVNGSQWVSTTAGGQGAYLPLTGGTISGNMAVTGNVGIGTTSPSYKLDVTGGTASFVGSSGVGAIRVAGAGGSWFWIDNPTTTTMRFSSGATAGTNPMVLDSSGNVGIGTSSPLGRFTSERAAASAGWVLAGKSAGVSNESGVYIDGSNNAEFAARNGSGTLTVRIGSTGDSYITGGNVGIGTSSPSQKFHVAGSGSTYTRVSSSNASTGAGSYFVNATSTWLIGAGPASGGSEFAFVDQTSGSIERARIDSSGNFMVGTTSAGATLTVYHGGNQKSADFYGAGNVSGTPVMSCRKGANDSTTSNVYIQFLYNNGTTGSGQINGNGGSQAAFGSYSDIRLKQNVESLPSQLENICSLRPVEFDYIESGEHQIGFIAQEMQEVYPDAVAVGNDDMLTITGWNKTEARLVSAIKELKAELDAVKSELATLKGAQ